MTDVTVFGLNQKERENWDVREETLHAKTGEPDAPEEWRR